MPLKQQQEALKKWEWDSEREQFYDDIPLVLHSEP